MENKYSGFSPMSHTQAPIENRMSNVFDGGESYFTDDEARAVLPELQANFVNVVAVRNCPGTGFTRLAAFNVRFEFYPNGTRFIGEPL